ncbi:RIP metalloprotease RseP [Bauldia sp.]|uniref:RIP metalloprotease RseP n=1 Tax=Bauldia sp. TaxID=2575872 RepID=UPI003BA93E74
MEAFYSLPAPELVLRLIVPVLIILTVIVFIHELGHFLAARWCGVGVRVFSVGFGPELFGFTDRHGTRWRFSAIPLGGYVKFVGDENEASQTDRDALAKMSDEERRRSFAAKGVGARAFIVAAGPAANFILAIAIFAVVFAVNGRQISLPRVDTVVAASPAEAAGFQAGDVIVSIDGTAVDSFADVIRVVSFSGGAPLQIGVERGSETLVLTATPERREETDAFGNESERWILGIQHAATADDIRTERYSVPGAVGLAVAETWFIAERTVSYLVGIIVGRESVDQLGGPVRVAEISGQLSTLGILPLINLTAFLSISIGLINLFPVPILDGGHLMFFAFEAIRGRPLSERAQDIGFRIGFVAVVMLMIFTTVNDIMR